MCPINQLKPIIYIGKGLGVEFCTWDKKFKPNYQLITKIAICSEILIVTALVYAVLPKTTKVLLNVTEIAFWVKMVAVEYTLVNYFLGTYLTQNAQVQVYASIQDTDLTLEKFGILALENTVIKRLIWIASIHSIILTCYVLYCYDYLESSLPAITYLIPSILSIYKALSHTCTVLILKDQFAIVNGMVDKFNSGGKCFICSEHRQIFIIDGLHHSLNGMCEQHTVRSCRLLHEKIADTCTVLDKTWNYMQSSNLTWAFTELLYQCLVWYEILNKHITINWNSAVLSFFAIFTALFTTFIFVQGCEDTTTEVHFFIESTTYLCNQYISLDTIGRIDILIKLAVRRFLHAAFWTATLSNCCILKAVKTRKILYHFFLNSKHKSIIKEDVKSFLLQMFHRESPFADSGMPADTSNTLVSELSALVTILVFGIQYNLPRSEGDTDL